MSPYFVIATRSDQHRRIVCSCVCVCVCVCVCACKQFTTQWALSDKVTPPNISQPGSQVCLTWVLFTQVKALTPFPHRLIHDQFPISFHVYNHSLKLCFLLSLQKELTQVSRILLDFYFLKFCYLTN